jgi:hypothetical protein
LVKPDTKFDANGVYSVDLDLDPNDKEVKAFVASIKKAADTAYAEACEAKGGKKLKRADLSIKETEDGMLRFKFKLKAKGGTEDKSWDQKPMLFDAKGNPIANPPSIGSGSKIRVAFELVPYFTAMVGAGVTFRMRAVQICELREYTPDGGFDAFGFKATDGYSAGSDTPATTQDDATEESDGVDF